MSTDKNVSISAMSSTDLYLISLANGDQGRLTFELNLAKVRGHMEGQRAALDRFKVIGHMDLVKG